jgi:hypothetical protein
MKYDAIPLMGRGRLSGWSRSFFVDSLRGGVLGPDLGSLARGSEGFGRQQRQSDREGGSLVYLAAHPDGATVRVHNRLTDA